MLIFLIPTVWAYFELLKTKFEIIPTKSPENHKSSHMELIEQAENTKRVLAHFQKKIKFEITNLAFINLN